jgi:hypothetical protein
MNVIIMIIIVVVVVVVTCSAELIAVCIDGSLTTGTQAELNVQALPPPTLP